MKQTTGIADSELMEQHGNYPLYDLQGRRVDSSSKRKGLYISNGKKVVY